MRFFLPSDDRLFFALEGKYKSIGDAILGIFVIMPDDMKIISNPVYYGMSYVQYA